MTTMLEKAARDVERVIDGPCLNDRLATEIVKAVLTAVRDPDEAEMQQMTEAYGAAFAATFAVRYRAVIDAILSEPQP